jgi:rRNA maturation endonuclease Nob1
VTAALVIGTFLAVGALAVVLYPLFFGDHATVMTTARVRGESPPEGETAVQALREIEFDRETGKLSDADYAELKARYTQAAVDAMRRRESEAAAGIIAGVASGTMGVRLSDDELEAAIRAYRAAPACSACGPRPEPDAAFCSSCGRYLHDRCAGCGAPVGESDARFCTNCGQRLAA